MPTYVARLNAPGLGPWRVARVDAVDANEARQKIEAANLGTIIELTLQNPAHSPGRTIDYGEHMMLARMVGQHPGWRTSPSMIPYIFPPGE